jgi:type IV secretory pathway TraG/TraD family ATPase VirD4
MFQNVPIEPPPVEESPRLFTPYVESVVPKYDVYNPISAPSMDGMELEYRKSPSVETDVFYAASVISCVLLVILLLNSFLVGPLGRLCGTFLSSSIMIPVYVLISLIFGIGALRSPLHTSIEVVLCFGGPIIAPLAVAAVYGSPAGSAAGIAIALCVLAALGAIADSITTHYYYFLTANPRLPRVAVIRRREWWKNRFNPDRLRSLKNGASDEHKLELGTLSEYAFGFAILIAYASLSSLHGTWPFMIVPLVAAMLWAYHRPALMPPLRAFVREVICKAFLSWLCWARWEGKDGSRRPGVFVSPRGTAQDRLRVTAVAFWGIAAIFVPPALTWWRDLSSSRLWLFAALVMLIRTFVLPLVVVLTVFIAVGGSSLGQAYQAIESPDAPETKSRRQWTDWECCARRLADSQHPLEKDHFYMGDHKEARYPILLHRKLLTEHTHILGPTGTAKTSLGVVPLIRQFIIRRDCPVIIFDLKGDPATRAEVYSAAKEVGATVKIFTNELGKATYTFNPFLQASSEHVSFSQRVEQLIEALNLEYGLGYGRSFFTSQQRSHLLVVISEHNITSFEDLHSKTTPEYFEKGADRERCKELIAKAQQLAEVQALNWTGKPGENDEVAKNAIFMPDVIEKNQIIIFCLPALGESSTARSIGCLGINAVMAALKEYKDLHGREKITPVFIDEFQRIASTSVEILMQQGRSHGLSLILSNQTLSDLKTRDAPGLLSSVVNNTNVRQYFGASDPDIEDLLISQSGETLYEEAVYSPEANSIQTTSAAVMEAGLTGGVTSFSAPYIKLKVGKRHNRTDVKRYSSQSGVSILHCKRESGYTRYSGQWFAMETGYHIDQENFEKRQQSPWPEATEHMIVALRPPIPTVPEKKPVRPMRILTAQEMPVTTNSRVPSSSTSAASALDPSGASWETRLKTVYEKRKGFLL